MAIEPPAILAYRYPEQVRLSKEHENYPREFRLSAFPPLHLSSHTKQLAAVNVSRSGVAILTTGTFVHHA